MLRGAAELTAAPLAHRVDGSKKTTDGQYVRYVQMDYKQSIWNYRQENHVGAASRRGDLRRFATCVA